MRILSIQQPWASLIVMGIKDVENRSWNAKYRGKMLIHASSRKVPKNYLYNEYPDWTSNILNLLNTGAIPNLQTLPTNAIVGYVDLTDVIVGKMVNSVWEATPETFKFILKNAMMFDTPILGVNGKLNIWNYPDIDENNLPPAHKYTFPQVTAKGEELIIPLTKEHYERCLAKKSFSLCSTESLKNVVCENSIYNDDTCPIKKFTSLTITLPDGEVFHYKLKNGIRRFAGQAEQGVDFTYRDMEGNEKTLLFFSGEIEE